VLTELSPCPLCKKPPRGVLHARRGVSPIYGVDMPEYGLECDVCKEIFYSSSEVRRQESYAAATIAERGIETPGQFKFIRKQANLQAAQLAALLDVAPETISRWEHGERPIPRLAAFALAELYLHPKLTRAKLEALAKPRPQRPKRA
jgi:DNA-binding transcriptional regulator YiaG